MKKIILLLLVISFTACNTSHPDYESNKQLAQKWVETLKLKIWIFGRK